MGLVLSFSCIEVGFVQERDIRDHPGHVGSGDPGEGIMVEG